VRHADCTLRRAAVVRMTAAARAIAERRGLRVAADTLLDQPSAPMDRELTDLFGPLHRMTSGAGHDAMTMARRMPAALLFLRSPGGVSHHPDETVYAEDIAAALEAGRSFLEKLEARIG